MSLFSYIWPIALVVLSNVVYHICAKSMPGDLDPFASLIITYLIGAATSAVLYFSLNRGSADLIREYGKLNWSPFALGVVIVGLETGVIYAYKAGWQVSTENIVQSAILSVILIAVGFLLYREPITWSKGVGVLICLVGLYFINR